MKIIRINNKLSHSIINTMKNVRKNISTGTVLSKEAVLPLVSAPIAFNILRSERETKEKLLQDTLNNEYISDVRKNNINTLAELENRGIIKPQGISEPPRFKDDFYTNDYYNKLIDSIKNSTKLTDYEKEQYIKSVASNNYKTPPSFKGAPESDDITDTPEVSSPEDTGFFSAAGTKLQNMWGQIKSKFTFKGSEPKETTALNETIQSNTHLESIEAQEEARLQADLKWVEGLKEEMCPACEEIYHAVPDEVPEGLMSNIMDEIPEGFEADQDLLHMLRGMTKDLLGEQL